jgi:hypothetical protein
MLLSLEIKKNVLFRHMGKIISSLSLSNNTFVLYTQNANRSFYLCFFKHQCFISCLLIMRYVFLT